MYVMVRGLSQHNFISSSRKLIAFKCECRGFADKLESDKCAIINIAVIRHRGINLSTGKVEEHMFRQHNANDNKQQKYIRTHIQHYNASKNIAQNRRIEQNRSPLNS